MNLNEILAFWKFGHVDLIAIIGADDGAAKKVYNFNLVDRQIAGIGYLNDIACRIGIDVNAVFGVVFIDFCDIAGVVFRVDVDKIVVNMVAKQMEDGTIAGWSVVAAVDKAFATADAFDPIFGLLWEVNETEFKFSAFYALVVGDGCNRNNEGYDLA